jgi:hypothetical protein
VTRLHVHDLEARKRAAFNSIVMHNNSGTIRIGGQMFQVRIDKTCFKHTLLMGMQKQQDDLQTLNRQCTMPEYSRRRIAYAVGVC